jgi:hypothetical protein
MQKVKQQATKLHKNELDTLLELSLESEEARTLLQLGLLFKGDEGRLLEL